MIAFRRHWARSLAGGTLRDGSDHQLRWEALKHLRRGKGDHVVDCSHHLDVELMDIALLSLREIDIDVVKTTPDVGCGGRTAKRQTVENLAEFVDELGLLANVLKRTNHDGCSCIGIRFKSSKLNLESLI